MVRYANISQPSHQGEQETHFQHFENARYAININGELNNCDGDGGTLELVESSNREEVGNWQSNVLDGVETGEVM